MNKLDLTEAAKIIENIFKDALKKDIYHFGIAGKTTGTSNKIASGDLYNSIKAIPTENNDDDLVIGVEMEDYGKFVQTGRVPGKKGVPISNLMLWIKERNIRAKDKNGKEIKPKQLAFAMQKTIKRFGIPTKPGWWDVAYKEMYENKELEEAIGDMTIDFFGEKINNIEK